MSYESEMKALKNELRKKRERVLAKYKRSSDVKMLDGEVEEYKATKVLTEWYIKEAATIKNKYKV